MESPEKQGPAWLPFLLIEDVDDQLKNVQFEHGEIGAPFYSLTAEENHPYSASNTARAVDLL